MKWQPGMKVLGGDRITEHTLAIVQGAVPDCGDPATMGCLMAQVRESAISLHEAEDIASTFYRYLVGTVDPHDLSESALQILERNR